MLSSIPYSFGLKLISNILVPMCVSLAPTIVYNSHGVESSKIEDIELVDKMQPISKPNEHVSSGYYLPFHLEYPSSSDVASRVISAAVFDLPCFVIKNLYYSPLQTSFVLYMILPKDIWYQLYPKILSM